MADIQLNFVNQSNDLNNSTVVIFQQSPISNAAPWKVIKGPAVGEKHPIAYPSTHEPVIYLGVSDDQATAGIASINTEISLLGISSADIWMTGGGSEATPVAFSLHDVNYI